MAVGSEQNIINLRHDTKLLGVYIDETMSWDNQISLVITTVQNCLRILYKIRSLTKDSRTLIAFYRSLVEPYFDHCGLVWGSCSRMRANQLQKLQNRAASIITKADYSVRSCDILKELCWPTLRDWSKIQMNITMYKVYHAAVPEY